MKLMRESLLLILIGLADLVATLLFVGGRGFVEGNPLMAYYLRLGVGAFVLVKLSLLFLPIFVAEWSKRYKPKFVRWMLRGAIVVYVGAYVSLFATVNILPMAKESAHPTVQMAQRAR